MPLATELMADRWENLLCGWVTPEECTKLKGMPSYAITSGLHLVAAVGIERARLLITKCIEDKVFPEMDHKGYRRCVWVGKDRCETYSKKVVCKKHMAHAVTTAPGVFKSPLLSEAFKHYSTSPSKMTLDNELALQRTMLYALTNKVNSDDVPMDMIGAITALCDKIGSSVERMSKLNVITPEVVDRMLVQVVNIMSEYVPAQNLEEASKKILQINVLEPIANIPYEPGDEVKAKDMEFKLKRAGELKRTLELMQVQRELE